jgi:hypothetical protein
VDNLTRRLRSIDEHIRRMEEAGELRGLPGEGRPLPPDPDQDAGEAWAARHVLRTSGARPRWADLRREITERRARLLQRCRTHLRWLDHRERLLERAPAERIVSDLRATREVDARVRRELADAVAELNALIRRYNLEVTPALQLHVIDAATLFDRVRAERH